MRHGALLHAVELANQRYAGRLGDATPQLDQEVDSYITQQERLFLIAAGARDLHLDIVSAFERAYPNLIPAPRLFDEEQHLVYKTVPPCSRLAVARMAGLVV